MVFFNKRKEQNKTQAAQIEGLKSALNAGAEPVSRWQFEEQQRQLRQLRQDVNAIVNHLGIALIHNQTVVREVPQGKGFIGGSYLAGSDGSTDQAETNAVQGV